MRVDEKRVSRVLLLLSHFSSRNVQFLDLGGSYKGNFTMRLPQVIHLEFVYFLTGILLLKKKKKFIRNKRGKITNQKWTHFKWKRAVERAKGKGSEVRCKEITVTLERFTS